MNFTLVFRCFCLYTIGTGVCRVLKEYVGGGGAYEEYQEYLGGT